MAANWMRRIAGVAACASAVLLAACGSSTIESKLSPDRFIAFGDGYSDVGQVGGKLYTVNNVAPATAINNWSLEFASRYGKTLTPASAGGLSYAQGNSRVTAADATGGNAPSITSQINTFLASNSFGANDVVLINGGFSDIIAANQADPASVQTVATQAAKDMAVQVRRLVNSGAKYVFVTGVYDLSKTPWGVASGNTENLAKASALYDDTLKVTINDLSKNVAFFETALYMNLFTNQPGSYSFDNSTGIACTVTDPGQGIGIGAGQVNSSLCTTANAVGTNYDKFVYADKIYATPNAHRQLGDYAFDNIRRRW